MILLHDELAGDRILEVAHGVLGLDLHEFLLHVVVLLPVALDLLLVGRGNVGLAEQHQVVDVVACVEEQTAYGGVCDLVGNQRDGAHVQRHQFLDVLHVVGLRHLQPREHALDHLRAQVFVPAERPARPRLPFLGGSLADVVQQGRPAEPYVVAGGGHVVEHLEGVTEVVLVPPAGNRLHPFEISQRRQHGGQQPAFVKQIEADGRLGRAHDLHQFIGDALGRKDSEPVLVAAHRVDGLGHDGEAQLRGETDGTEHPERVVAIGGVGVERRADETCIEVADAAERIDQAPVVFPLQAESHGVDGEVAALLVFFQRAVFHDGLARRGAVRLAACSHELHFHAVAVQHGGAEILEHGDFDAESVGYGLGQGDAAALHYDVDVVAGPLQEEIAHVAPDDESTYALLARGLRHDVEDSAVQSLAKHSAKI